MVALVGLLYMGRDFFVPIVFAFYLDAAFRPLMRVLRRTRLPNPVSAGIIVIGAALALYLICAVLSVPVRNWVAAAPRSLSVAEAKLTTLRRPVEQVTDAAAKIEHVTRGPSTSTTQPLATAEPPALVTRFFESVTKLVEQIVEVFLLLYLLLASGELFQQKMITVLPLLREKKAVVQIVNEIESSIVHWVGLAAMINFVQAVVIALIMWALGVPAPLLWGALTFGLEFIPYLGATVMIILLGVTSFATFDAMGHILAVPASYLLVTTIQNSVVSPFLYGKRLQLNPVVIFIGVLFWWFVWGLGGAFLAVPIVATMKIVCDRIPLFAPVGEFLAE
jgi:predicted PurR-regulated permease PerM